jgi:hypothetical protein
MHKVDLQSISHSKKVRTDIYRQEEYVDMYFEGIKDDIQFDSVLSADEVIYLACIGEGHEYQNGYDQEKCAQDIGFLRRGEG